MKYVYETARSISQIDLDKLYNRGKRCILIDLDNTIARWHTYTIKDDAVTWIEKAKSKGFKVCILSNSHNRQRPKEASKILKIDNCAASAKKPSEKAFLDAAEHCMMQKKEIIMVGDQLFCDVRGAIRAGIDAVLVDPIYKKEAFITKIMRFFERLKGRKINWQDNMD